MILAIRYGQIDHNDRKAVLFKIIVCLNQTSFTIEWKNSLLRIVGLLRKKKNDINLNYIFLSLYCTVRLG